jgi:hypothetical protein
MQVLSPTLQASRMAPVGDPWALLYHWVHQRKVGRYHRSTGIHPPQ